MPKVEKAVYNPPVSRLKGYAGEYGRVYIGAEFCQWRLPGPAAVLRAYERASELGMGFTMLTPWVTDAGMRRLAGIFGKLDEAGAEAEVAVNDIGVLSLLAERFPSFTPVLGRLLSRQKRCPRVPGVMDGLPEAGRGFYLHAGADDPVAARFLRGFGIKRVELDSPLQGIQTDLKAVRLRGSIYTPFAYVTTTRNCPASFDGKMWQAYSGCKVKGCAKNIIELASPAHREPLLMRGNTQFIRNECLPEDLAAMGIDRVVVMEGLP